MQQIADRKQYESEFVRAGNAKMFVDDHVNVYGIHLRRPFEGTENEHGRMNVDPANAIKWTTEFDQQGVSVHFHAIGEDSIDVVIDALTAAAEANGGTLKTRHYPGPDQTSRLAELNGLIGFAPYHAFTFPGVHDSYIPFLAEERLRGMQPARTALDAGAIIASGTDWASLPQDPFPLMEGMVHRRNPWLPADESIANNGDKAISIEEAIRAYTLAAAYALLREDELGSIEAGKYADFIVLDRNLIEIPVDEIDSTVVLKTGCSGSTVYEHGIDDEPDNSINGPDRVVTGADNPKELTN